MEQATPEGLFDQYALMSDESQTAFLKLLAEASTADVPLFIVAFLSPAEGRRFAEIEFALVIDNMFPFLIEAARRFARENPDTTDDEFDRALQEQSTKFMADYGEKARELERASIEGQRNRKSDPATILRNVEICNLRKHKPKLWTQAKLAKKYDLTPQMIRKILGDEAKWRTLAARLSTN